MGYQLVDLGEEFIVDSALDGISVTVTLYNDTTDTLDDNSDVGDITSEPGGSNYSRQSATLTTKKSGGDYQGENSSQISFDTSDSTGDVDSYAVLFSFTADETGDGSDTLHLIANGALSETRTIDDVDTVNVSAGTVGVSLT